MIEKKDARDLIFKRGDIRMDNLSFSYQKFEPVIKNFSIDIKAGESILITGASGIGKSTLINLLMRLYDPSEGTVEIDG